MNSIVYNSKKRFCEIRDLVDYYPAFIDFCTNRGIVFINEITEEDIIAFKIHYNVKLVDISYIRTILQNSDMPSTKKYNVAYSW